MPVHKQQVRMNLPHTSVTAILSKCMVNLVPPGLSCNASVDALHVAARRATSKPPDAGAKNSTHVDLLQNHLSTRALETIVMRLEDQVAQRMLACNLTASQDV